MTINRVELDGRIGCDPVFRSMQDGMPVIDFSLATSEALIDPNRPQRGSNEHTEWHQIRTIGKFVDMAQKLKKGMRVSLWGRLKTGKEQGRTCTTVIVDQTDSHNLSILSGLG